MEEKQQKPNFTHKDIRDIFYLSDQTIQNYIRDGMLPFPEIQDGELVFDRKLVLKSLGLKDLPPEPFIVSAQVIDILKLPKGKEGANEVGNLCRKKLLPYYRFSSIKNTCYLFFGKRGACCNAI